jgi:hypothetical protein
MGIRYFSGHATYTKEVKILAVDLRQGSRIRLDLGKVAEIADLSVNGTRIGTAWHAPYRLDVTEAFHAGQNKLDIGVVDLWVNCLNRENKTNANQYTFAPRKPYKAASPPMPAGLLVCAELLREDRMREVEQAK